MRNPPSLAKISRPRLPEVFLRLRLFRWLDRALKQPVVWVVGPPGAGKTTLLASYLKHRRLGGLWYQVDEGDSDPATFFHYMGLAARGAARRGRAPLRHLTPEHRPALDTFARRFFRELYELLEPHFAVVVDNCQDVAPDSVFHQVISKGLDELPEGGHVVLISRSDPPPAVARHFANRSMAVLGWDELRLTPGESAGIARLRRRKLGRGALPTLHRMAEGWAAGLVLMLARAGSGRSPAVLARETAGQAVFDYFAGEIFEKTDRKTRALLLQTAFVPSFSAGLAARLTGIDGAGRLLADLHRNHYFTERRVEAEAEFQYHPLFRDFLLARARATYGGARLGQIRRRAAALLEERGRIEDAAELFGETKDWEGLARLVVAHAPALLAQGRDQTLEAWLRSLPPALFERTPWLQYWLGRCRLPFDTAEAREQFAHAFAGFQERDERAGLFLSWAGVIDTFVYQWGDFTSLDRWIAVLQEELARDPRLPPGEIAARVAFGMFAALMHRQPANPALPEWEERVRGIVLESPDPTMRMMLGNYLIYYYLQWRGDPARAKMVLDALQPLEHSPSTPALARIVWHGVRATYERMAGSAEDSLTEVEEGLAMARTTGVHILDFVLCNLGVRGSLAGGDLPRAERYLMKMTSVLNPAHAMNVCIFHYTTAMVALWRGDAAAALEHGLAAIAQGQKSGVPHVLAMAHLTAACALSGRGRHGEAEARFETAGGGGHTGAWLDFLRLFVKAKLALDRGDEQAGVQALRDALAAGSAQGLVEAPSWFSPPEMARLCAKALEHGIEVDYVQGLIRNRGLAPPGPSLEPAAWPWAVKVFTLGPFAVLVGGRPLRAKGRTQRRPLELLKALIAFGGRAVSEERLTAALWPDAEGDAGHRAFETTLHRLRKLLGVDKAIVLREGRLSIDTSVCWVDAMALEVLLQRIGAAGDPRTASRLVEQAAALQRGPFLAEEPEHAWARQLRERLRRGRESG